MSASSRIDHARLRDLGHGWIVDLVEAAPAPCLWRARPDPLGIEVRAELERCGLVHTALQVLTLETIEALSVVFRDDHVQRAIDRLGRRVLRLAEDHEAAVAHRRSLRGTRGLL